MRATTFPRLHCGIDLGFNAVMVESHHLGFEEYKALVKRVVAFGKDRERVRGRPDRRTAVTAGMA